MNNSKRLDNDSNNYSQQHYVAEILNGGIHTSTWKTYMMYSVAICLFISLYSIWEIVTAVVSQILYLASFTALVV